MIAQILVVDDDHDVRKSLKDLLESWHHRVLEAEDGAEAFAVADKELPHLILMDVVMGNLYGTSALERLRENPRTAKIPIILMSGTADKRALGVEDGKNMRFMKKPLDPKELEKVLRELLPEGGYTP